LDCDVDVDEPFAQWKCALLPRLKEDSLFQGAKENAAKGPTEAEGTATPSISKHLPPAKSLTRESPLLASLVEKRSLTLAASTKSTLHLAFSIEGTGLCYEAGDACGVVPSNDPNLVAEILQKLRFNDNEGVPSATSGMTALHDALSHQLQITRLNRKMVQVYAERGNCTPLLDLLQPEHRPVLDSYIHGRGLIDLLLEYPGVIDDPVDLVGLVPKLSPRLYSISSSPAVHAGQIHTTVAVVRFTSHNRDRGGVCSTLFADRTSIADRLPIYIQPNKKFKLPSNPDAPMIMIGPGTGIAPFRGFLHERRALGHKGRNWLFFGERSSATDYLYRDELESMYADRHLTQLDTAFSRDNGHKVYVQDRMMEQAPQFWNWLQDGASVYVCGDAARMAKEVHGTLCRIVQDHGVMSEQAAEEYVGTLKEQHRYHRDVY
jgi:sulfite reductase (NADPH) flavoprotein alpha-component